MIHTTPYSLCLSCLSMTASMSLMIAFKGVQGHRTQVCQADSAPILCMNSHAQILMGKSQGSFGLMRIPSHEARARPPLLHFCLCLSWTRELAVSSSFLKASVACSLLCLPALHFQHILSKPVMPVSMLNCNAVRFIMFGRPGRNYCLSTYKQDIHALKAAPA